MNDLFSRAARVVSRAVGSTTAFVLAAGAIVVWVASGPIFDYSEQWQLVVNTGTTIVTFLMVFIIQNAENRDQKAIQLKLDELLRAIEGAKTGYVSLEELDDSKLEKLEGAFKAMHERHSEDTEKDVNDVG